MQFEGQVYFPFVTAFSTYDYESGVMDRIFRTWLDDSAPEFFHTRSMRVREDLVMNMVYTRDDENNATRLRFRGYLAGMEAASRLRIVEFVRKLEDLWIAAGYCAEVSYQGGPEGVREG